MIKCTQNQDRIGRNIDGIYRVTVLHSIIKTRRQDVELQRRIDDVCSSRLGKEQHKMPRSDKRKLDKYMKNLMGVQNLEETRKIEESRRRKK